MFSVGLQIGQADGTLSDFTFATQLKATASICSLEYLRATIPTFACSRCGIGTLNDDSTAADYVNLGQNSCPAGCTFARYGLPMVAGC
jgi:hypothetical protein